MRKYIDAEAAKTEVTIDVAKEQMKYPKDDSYITFLNGFKTLFEKKIDEMPAAKVVEAEALVCKGTMEYCGRKAIATYGADAQIDMMIEEMSKLAKALLKYRRAKSDKTVEAMEKAKAKYSILEEIADVHIVLRQMEMMYDSNNEISDIISRKLKCLEYRIEKSKEGEQR